MILDVKPGNKWCQRHAVPKFSIEAIKTDILKRNRVSSGFTLVNTPAPVSDEVFFKAYGKGDELLIAALLLRRPAPGIRPYAGKGGRAELPADETFEILFDPRHDHIGYFQFLFSSAGTVQRFQHLPYPEAHSTAFPFMDVRSHAWEPYLDMGGQLRGLWFFARFSSADVFRGGKVCGLNVARCQSGAADFGSWNPTSGVGFPDATSFGHLYAGKPANLMEIAQAGFSKGRLRLSGVGRPTGRRNAVRLVNPLGERTVIPVKARGKGWAAELPLSPVHGLYRLYPVRDDAGSEPHFSLFTLAGRQRPAFRMGMEYDYPDNMIRYPYSPASLGAELSLLRGCGVSRIYWIDYPLAALKQWDWGAYPAALSNIEKTRKQCGEILPVAARLAKERGMEFFAVYKVFDLGNGGHPEWTMQSNPAWETSSEHPVARVRLYSLKPLGALRKADFRIWVSKDNKTYTAYRGAFQFRQGTVRRPHLRQSPAGNIREKGSATNRFVEFGGLSINAPYLVVEILKKAPEFMHRAFAFVEAMDKDGRALPAIPGQGNPEKGFSFSAEWSWGNRSERVLDMFAWKGGAVGFRFSKRAYSSREGTASALPEPMFKGVQDRWLAGIRTILKTRADGVDIRILCHHVLVRDYLAVAFAEPVRRAFRERYGRDAEPVPEDYERIRRLRGEAFTQFMRAAKKLTRSFGKKLCAHIECGQEVPPQDDVRMQIHFEWEKWIEEGILDEITLKFWSTQSPFVHERILPLARKKGIPVHVCDRNSALHSARGIERCERLIGEALAVGFSGYHFYEAADYLYLNSAGAPMTFFNVDAGLRQAAKKLEKR